MSALQKLKALFGSDGDSAEFRHYECRKCDHGFRSAKSPERVQCPECLSNDIATTEGERYGA